MKSLILSSGFGTRLYPLTETRAKGLLELRGKPMIDYVVENVPGDVGILVNTNQKFEADFRQWAVSATCDIKLCVEPVLTEEQSLGAIGSIAYWIMNENITEDLLVLASDNYFEFDMSRFIAAFNGHNILVAVHDIGDIGLAGKYGVVRLDGSRIVEFEEKPARPKSSLIATACWVIPSRVFPVLLDYSRADKKDKKDNLGSFITYLLEETGEEVSAYPFSERWLDVGSIEVYNSLRETL